MLTSVLPMETAIAQPADSPWPMTNPNGANSVTKTKTDYITVTTIENLLINPDAETGDTQGWVDLDDAWSADDEITPHGGDYFFWPARLDIHYTQMYQDVDISEYASSIDSCNAYLHLSGWLANWDQYPHDRATLAIEALDTNNQQLLYLSRHHRSPVWTYYKIESQIPAGSRTLRILLIATRYVGSDNDGYFDDLCLEVDNNAPDVFVTITPEGVVPEVAVGSTLQLYATTTGGVDSAYIWSSSFNAVATVDESGLVTAHRTGRCVIQAEGTSTHAVGYLEIVAYSPNYVIFTHPQSGEKWEGGTNHDITWELIGSIDSGTLYYSTTGGGEWTEIDQIPDLSVQQYSWLVPDTDEILNDGIIKMVWSGGEATSSVFSIVPSKPTPTTTKKPDLTPYKLTWKPTDPTTSDSITITWRVKNQGDADAIGKYQTRLYIDGEKIATWGRSADTLAVGKSAFASKDIGTLSAGEYTVKVVTDTTEIIDESDETNNEYTKILTVTEDTGYLWLSDFTQD